MVKNIQQQITHCATYESIVDSCEERKFGPDGFGAVSKWAAPPRGLQSAAPAPTARTTLSATPRIDQNGSRWSRAGKGTTRCSRAPKLLVKFDGVIHSIYMWIVFFFGSSVEFRTCYCCAVVSFVQCRTCAVWLQSMRPTCKVMRMWMYSTPGTT